MVLEERKGSDLGTTPGLNPEAEEDSQAGWGPRKVFVVDT